MSNSIEKITRDLRGFGLGQHLCAIYKNQIEQFAIIIPYMRIGLENNEKCIYIIDENSKDDIVKAFLEFDIDIHKHIQSKQFEFFAKEEVYLKDGYFDPDRMIELLRNSEKQALKDGYSGLRVTGEMTWVFTKLPGTERLMEYEVRLNYLIPQSKIIAVCQYNESKFQPHVLVDMIHAHPKIIIYHSVCQNPYYIPPDEYTERAKGKVSKDFYERIRDDIVERSRIEAEHGFMKQQYEAILKAAMDGFWIVDENGNFLDANEAYSKMIGYSLDELRKMKIQDIDVVRDAGCIKNHIQKIRVKGFDRFETKHRCKDNRVLDVEVTINYMHVDEGVLFAFIRDITERKKTEVFLRDSQLKVRAVFDQAFQFIGLMTVDGILIEANRAALDFAGIEASAVLNRPFWETPWWTHSKELQFKLRESIEKVAAGEFVRFEATHVAKDGSVHYIDFSLKPAKDESGKVIYIIPEGRDITDRKKLEEALKESYAELGLRVKVRTAELSKANEDLYKEIGQRKHLEERIMKLSNLKAQLLIMGDFNHKLKLITDGVVDIFNADFARIWIIKDGDLCQKGCIHASITEGSHACRDRSHCLHLVSSSGRYTNIDGGHRRVPIGSYKVGRIASGEDANFVTNDVTHDPRIHNPEWAKSLGLVSFAGYRLSSPEGSPIGVLAFFSKQTIISSDEGLLNDFANSVSHVIMAEAMTEALRRNEERFRGMVERAPLPYQSLDIAGRFIYVNQAWLGTLGYTEGEVIGRSFSDFLSPGWEKAFAEAFPVFKVEGKVNNREFEMVKKDGSSIVVSVDGRIGYDEKGEFKQTHCIFTDITERKRSEERLLISETRFRRLFEAAKDGILILNADTGKIIDVNPFMIELLGYSQEEFLGKELWEFISFKGIVPSKEALLEWQNKEYIRYGDVMIEGKDGSKISVEFVSNIYAVDHQKVIQINIRDISERKRMEQELKERMRDLEDFSKFAVDRELKMEELEKRIAELEGKLRVK